VSKWKYIEIRPSSPADLDGPDANAVTKDDHCGGQNTRLPNAGDYSFVKCKEYNLHKIDLRPNPETIFSNFHKSFVQRKIRRAEQEGLQYEAGRSPSSVEKFYELLLLTRRRHGLPPQPVAWFRNLAAGFDENLTIRLASKGGRPIASILTLLHKKTLVYKYGCSDAALHKLGAMPMLFWKAIQEEKQRGAEEFDLGRSAISNPGLTVFKQHLGAACSRLPYYRLGRRELSITDSDMRFVHAVFARIPAPLAQIAGSVLYRHMG
jgi:lipid II:glycine glycyltransferase (peptidoglycan interpeptide bridge formation enzyme)